MNLRKEAFWAGDLDFLNDVEEGIRYCLEVEKMEGMGVLIGTKRYGNFSLYLQMIDEGDAVDVVVFLTSTGKVDALETEVKIEFRDTGGISPRRIVRLAEAMASFLAAVDEKITDFEGRIRGLVLGRWVSTRRLYVRAYEAEGWRPAFAATYTVQLDNISFEFRYDGEHKKFKYAVSVGDLDPLVAAASSIMGRR